MAISVPVKRTALHYTHLALRATMIDDCGWQRPERYGLPEEEVGAVRAGVGLCDMSPVGKLDLKGKDCVPVLARTLALDAMPGVGQIQRVILKDPDGVAASAGFCCRLSDDQVLLLTAPDATVVVEQRLIQQVGGGGGCVHLTNLTSALAAVQVVGPRSRDLLSKLTALDLSPPQFVNLTCTQGSVAKVHATVIHADVGSLLAYEVYCGREFGEYLWDTLWDAGQEFGAVPFGVAAQRLLRMEG
jgi:sarcosine oxidase subunit alpha